MYGYGMLRGRMYCSGGRGKYARRVGEQAKRCCRGDSPETLPFTRPSNQAGQMSGGLDSGRPGIRS